MTRSRWITVVVVAIAVLLRSAGLAYADDATQLERAKTSYDAGRYAEGAGRFKEILNPDSAAALHDPTAIERARAYYAACLIALDRNDEANAQIEKIFRNNPLYTPDPVVFPGRVIDRFLDVKSKLRGEIEEASRAQAAVRAKAERDQRAYMASLQKLASQETVVVLHSHWLAALPFGVGQFQNGQEGLGYAFLVTETLLAGTSVVAGFSHMKLVADFARQPTSFVYEDYESAKNRTAQLSVYSGVALAAVALAGIIQAEVAFVPEVRETRARPIPQPPPLTPTVGAGPSGFTLGVQARF
jgi:tetratricopeptide (TPR) repeat protein